MTGHPLDGCPRAAGPVAASLEDDAQRRMFMENHPLRGAIMASDLGVPPGWTWRPTSRVGPFPRRR